MTKRSQILKGILLTLVAALWASAYLIPYKAAAARTSPQALVLPLLMAAAGFNTVGMIFPRQYRTHKPPGFSKLSLWVAVLLGAFSALGNEAMAHALSQIEPGLASVLLRTQVIFVILGGWWVLRERVSIMFFIGMGLALVGFWILQGGVGVQGKAPLGGMLWALVAASGFAAMQVVVRKAIHRIDPVMVNGLRLWIGAALVACVPGRLSLLFQTNGSVWLLTALAAFFGPVVSRIFIMYGLKSITAALSTLILFVSPVFAFVLGGIFFGIWPTLVELLVCLIVLIGVALPVLESLSKQAIVAR